MKFVLALIFVLSPIVSLADVMVRWGEGQLKITSESKDAKFQNQLKVLQTQLLIDEELSNIIISSMTTEFMVIHNSNKNTLTQLKSKIKQSIMSTVDSTAAQKNSPKKNQRSKDKVDDDEEDYEIESHKTLVVVGNGDDYLVDIDDVVDTVVVMGGRLKVAGEVKRLVLVKGDVEVLSTGKIIEKVTELSGTINSQQGGFVTKDKSGLLDNFNISNIVVNEFSVVSGSWLKICLSFFRLIQVMFLLWLAFKLLPYFDSSLLHVKFSWLQQFFIGFLQLSALPFLLFILSVSLVGIALVPIYLTLLYLLGLLGYGVLSLLLGHYLFNKVSSEKRPNFIYFLLGFSVFELLLLAPVFGYLIFALLLVVSLGLATFIFMKLRHN